MERFRVWVLIAKMKEGKSEIVDILLDELEIATTVRQIFSMNKDFFAVNVEEWVVDGRRGSDFLYSETFYKENFEK